MLTHKEKVSLARKVGMRTKMERKRLRINQPGHGTMISKIFSSNAWYARKQAIENRQNKKIPAEKVNVAEELGVLDKPLVGE